MDADIVHLRIAAEACGESLQKSVDRIRKMCYNRSNAVCGVTDKEELNYGNGIF